MVCIYHTNTELRYLSLKPCVQVMNRSRWLELVNKLVPCTYFLNGVFISLGSRLIKYVSQQSFQYKM